jgi:hypothetical protein
VKVIIIRNSGSLMQTWSLLQSADHTHQTVEHALEKNTKF